MLKKTAKSKQCGNAEWPVQQKPQKIQASITEIDNIGDIRQLSNHCITVFIAFSHSRVHSALSVTATAALQQSSVTAPTVLPTTVNATPIPAITAVSVIKLAPLLRYFCGYRGNTVVPIPMQLSISNHCVVCTIWMQLLPLYVMDRMNYPGFPGFFTACVFSGALR